MRPGFLLVLALLARSANAQSLSGTVRDSVSRTALAGAIVQVVADTTAHVAHTVFADSLGRYTINELPDGRYSIGFSHPLLDSIGVQPPLHHLTLSGHRATRVDLATPSPAELRTAICGPRTAADSTGVVVGTVHEASDGAPMPGVSVVAQWAELSFTPHGIRRRTPSLAATTGENGWFAFCSVPTNATVLLTAARGADSTGVVEVLLPAEEFARRELWIGGGTAALSGRVLTSAGEPLSNARVDVAGAPHARTNDHGEWTIAHAPVGTRMLETRAIGYYPERRAVDVVAGAPAVRVVLSTVKAVLDTVRVYASRRIDRTRDAFEQRRTLGHGHFITGEEVARRNPLVTTDLFTAVAGVHLDRGMPDSLSLLIRGPGGGWCSPLIFLNGNAMHGLSAEEVDGWVAPSKVSAIEIYPGNTVPPQFEQLRTGCGSIVIWMKY